MALVRIKRRPTTTASIEPGGTWLFYGFLMLIAVEYLGVARDIPLLKAIRFSTILAYSLLIFSLARSEVRADLGRLFSTRQAKLVVAFIAFTVLSVLWAVVQIYAFNTIRDFVDSAVLFLLAAILVNSQKRINVLSWACLLISLVLVYRNLGFLGDASRTRHFEAGVFLRDGNDFAWGLVVLLPIIANIVFSQRSLVYRAAGWVGILACVLGVIGTSSRGGTLGLLAACLYYWLIESRRKGITAMVLMVGLLGVVLVAPQNYFDRMQTVNNYSQDNSARSRIQTWSGGIKMALDYPLGVGAGNFAAVYGRFYIPDPEHNLIQWAGGRWLSAHSIYFRTLGEYGFIGLVMLLWLIAGSVWDNLQIRGRLQKQGAEATLSPMWPSLLNMSLIGFAVCGAFLSGLTYPHLFLLTGLSVAAGRAAKIEVRSATVGRSRGKIKTKSLPH